MASFHPSPHESCILSLKQPLSDEGAGVGSCVGKTVEVGDHVVVVGESVGLSELAHTVKD